MVDDKRKGPSVDQLVTDSYLMVGADEVNKNPKDGSRYGLGALEQYLNTATDEAREGVLPWVDALANQLSNSEGVFPDWALSVMSNYQKGAIGRKLGATVGDLAQVATKIGYKEYMPKELAESKVVYGELLKQIKEISKKKPEELTDEEKATLKLGKAIGKLESVTPDGIKYNIDQIGISQTLNQLYPAEKKEG